MAKEKKEIVKFRSAKMRLLLYPDDPSHVQALERIKEDYDYAYILHEAEEETKKPHWHVVIRFKNAQWNTALAKNLGISENYIRNSSNLDKALQYLIHFNDVEKKQYDISSVKGSLVDRLKTSINKSDRTEDEEASILIDYIVKSSKRITIAEFSRFCVDNGYWSTYRRGQNIFRLLIKERNEELWQLELKRNMEERLEYEEWLKCYNKTTGEIYSTPFDYKQAEFDFLENNA